MPKAIAIRRVSTKDQAENNHSLAQQYSSVSAMAASLGAEIVKDWGMAVSAKKGNNLNRKDLTEALNYCRYKRNVQYLLIDKVSRFSRELQAVFHQKVEFEKLGVKIIFCDPHQQKFNADTAEAMYELARKAFEAESENEERSQTSITKMQARVAEGYYPFYPHQGYVKTPAANGLHIPDEKRFNLLRKALKAVSRCEMTPKQAVKWLNDQGYRTPKGNRPLDLYRFSKILSDPYYAGILQVKDWQINEHGLHKPMISKAEYETNLAIVSGRTIKKRRRHNPDFPLNLAFHAQCRSKGGKLTGINHTNGKGWWRKEYVCRACKKRVPQSQVHDSYQQKLEASRLTNDGIKALVKQLNQVWEVNEAYRTDVIENTELRLEKVRQRKSQLIIALAENPDLADEIRYELSKLKSNESELQLQLNQATDVDDDYEEFLNFSLNYISTLQSRFWQLEPDKQAECKQVLFNDEILVDDNGKVYTPKLSLIYTLEKQKDGQNAALNTQMVELVGTAPTSAGLSWLVVYRLSPF